MRRSHELAEVGKVLVGAGLGGYGGWLATMASVAGSGGQFRVWTIWSVLLVILSAAALVGGSALWWHFRDRSRHTYVQVPPGGVITVQSMSTQPAVSGTATATKSASAPTTRPNTAEN